MSDTTSADIFKPHILLVDDVAKNIQIVANLLKNEDCQISFAQSGLRALELIEKEQIDLVLLDVMMPVMDGYEVCRKIKANPSTNHLPVIFLTAKNDIESISLAFDAGGVDYITKPFNSIELLARVSTQLRLNRALKQLTSQRDRLEEVNSVKDKLFSIIAHDLRNPFNGLLVLTDILKYKLDKMEKGEIRKMIDLIYDSSKDGYDLLENLLEWSRSQKNQLEYTPVPVDVSKMVKGNIQLIKPMAISKNVSLVTDMPTKLVITADPHMIDTIIRNLITNAIKFTPEKGTILVKIKKAGDKVWFSVKDSGVGIDKKTLDKLFGSSVIHSAVGTANEKGTGLGILLCREFIQRHGGKIWAESETGKGSEFIFTLPL